MDVRFAAVAKSANCFVVFMLDPNLSVEALFFTDVPGLFTSIGLAMPVTSDKEERSSCILGALMQTASLLGRPTTHGRRNCVSRMQ